MNVPLLHAVAYLITGAVIVYGICYTEKAWPQTFFDKVCCLLLAILWPVLPLVTVFSYIRLKIKGSKR